MYNMYNDDIVKACMNTVRSKIKNMKTLNIVVCGKSGVGKSTLINAVFREDIAKTGTGKPVTQSMKKYEKKNVPLGIYDTKGFELGKEAQEEVKDEVLELIREGVASRDINQAIHCIWYCISTLSNRFEPEEIQWIREFTEENGAYQTPVILVLTQAVSIQKAEEMKQIIEEENLEVAQIVPVLAQDYEINEEYSVRAHGLEQLIEIMQEVLPDELLDTLANVQQVSLKMKRKKAHAAVASAVALATAAGAAPIPFSDAAALVPIEVGMLASITVIFGIEMEKAILTSLVSAVVGTEGATIAGKAIVSGLLKLIPGAGTVVGGVISGATAATLTTALGEAYIGVMTEIYRGELKEMDLKSELGQNRIRQLFLENFKKKK